MHGGKDFTAGGGGGAARLRLRADASEPVQKVGRGAWAGLGLTGAGSGRAVPSRVVEQCRSDSLHTLVPGTPV